MKEVHIIGGGLAGLSLGIFLRNRDIPVRLSEAAHYPRHRVCGEFISGIESGKLDELGIVGEFAGASECRSTAWYDTGGKFLEKELPVPATGISRHLLDSRLASKFEELGGVLECGKRASIGDPDHLVVATGRARNPEGKWLGLKCHLSGFDLQSDLEMHMSAGGYLGLCAIENSKVNACGLFRLEKSLDVSRETALEVYLKHCRLDSLRERIREAEKDADSCIAVNAFEFGMQPPAKKNEALCVGDRFSVIGPFTGHGMTLALESALISGRWIEKVSEGTLGWDDAVAGAATEMERTFRRRLKMSSLLHPFLTTAWGRGIFSFGGRHGLIPFQSVLHLVR